MIEKLRGEWRPRRRLIAKLLGRLRMLLAVMFAVVLLAGLAVGCRNELFGRGLGFLRLLLRRIARRHFHGRDHLFAVLLVGENRDARFFRDAGEALLDRLD